MCCVVSIATSSSKLDADYIQRYLGELSPFEESRLVQLRKTLQNDKKVQTMFAQCATRIFTVGNVKLRLSR